MTAGREAARFAAAVEAARAAMRCRSTAGAPTGWRLVDEQTGAERIAELQLATRFWPRFRGWMLRRAQPPSTGLLLAPCRDIHMMWMRFAIDAAFVDGDGQVLAVARGLRPWRLFRGPANAYAVIEAVAGGPLADLALGTRLAIVPATTHA